MNTIQLLKELQEKDVNITKLALLEELQCIDYDVYEVIENNFTEDEINELIGRMWDDYVDYDCINSVWNYVRTFTHYVAYTQEKDDEPFIETVVRNVRAFLEGEQLFAELF